MPETKSARAVWGPHEVGGAKARPKRLLNEAGDV
jgi:hypothetical protein